jgi:long-chain acyl-CoA synthetase
MIETLADLIRTHARERGPAPAITFEGHTTSYAELDETSSRLARGLLAEGVGAQDRVAFLDKNTPAYFTVLFGAGKINAVTVAVNWRLAAREMQVILDDAEAKVLFVGEDFLEHLRQMHLTTVTKIIVVGAAADAPAGHETLDSWLARFAPDDPGAKPAPDDTCFQLYTSGTTGLPKGVELTSRNFFSLMPVGSQEWGIDASTVNLVAMPMFHIAGSGWAMVGLFNGAHTVLLREVNLDQILDAIPLYRATVALFVPAVLQFLLQHPRTPSTDFSSLRTIVYGASPITRDVLVRSIETFGCGFIQAYGLTETTGGVVILRPADHVLDGPGSERLRAAGQPSGDTELRVVDPLTLEDCPEGRVGEVLIRSVQNMKGYWKKPLETAAAFLDGGWFRSGDAGYLKDGYLYIHDRVKDMIVSGGENIYPAEVENVLMGHSAVADVAVIGIPSEKWGETVRALVVRKPGQGDLTEADLITYCRERLAAYKCPTSIGWLDAIPRNPSGKILKTELRKPYWQDEERMVR